MTSSSPSPNHKLFSFGILALAIGLMGIGIGALIAPGWSAQTYGVPAAEPTWVRATGMRDLVLGLALLALRSTPTAQRQLLPIIFLLPLADMILVLLAGQPWMAALPHLGGILAVGALIVLGRSSSPKIV